MSEYAAFKLIGRSMEPILTIGDVILVKKVRCEDLKVSDMIVFKSHDRETVIVHRFVGFNDDGSLMTKPDTTIVQADSFPVKRECVTGKVIAAYRGKEELPIMHSGAMVRLFHRLLLALNHSPFYLKMKAAGFMKIPYRITTMIRRAIIIK
jgi:signal peptidase I